MNAALQTQSRHSERGNAGLLAIILVGFVTLTIMSIMTANGLRETRNLEKANSKLHEKWQARSALNILSAVVARNAPLQMNDDVAWAQRECGVSAALPLFDDDEVSLSHAAVAFNSSDRECNRAAPPTSLFGTFRHWSDARRPLFEETGQSLFNLDRERTKVLEMKEIYRRSFNGGSGVAYVARYTVEAKFGYYRTRAASEAVFSQNAPACGTSVSLEIAPPTLERGQPVELRVIYESANRLQIYNSANTLIHEEAVTQQNGPATFVFRFSPAVTETYHVIATGSGGCQARSAGVTVTVTDPPPPPACPTINFFTASSNLVPVGSTVTLSWNVSDAAEVRLDGVVVPSVGNRPVVMNDAANFTLTAVGPGGSCPQTRTLLVGVIRTGPCPIPIIQFSANPTSVLPNEAVTLSWNVTDLRAGAVITLTGPAGLNQTVAASGTLSVTPPPNPGVYVYRLRAEQICGTDAEQSLSVTVTNSCPPPVIDAFVATPNTVQLGFGGTINLAWTISGTADSVSISNGVGGALPASGNVDIPAPVVDTVYTLTVVGCSQTRTAQVTVRVTNPPPPPPPQPVQAIRAVWRDVIGFTPTGAFGGQTISDGYNLDNVSNVAEDGRVTGTLTFRFTKGWDTRVLTAPEATTVAGSLEVFDAGNIFLGTASFSNNCPAPPASGVGGINFCEVTVPLDFTPSFPASSAQPVSVIVTAAPSGLVFNSGTVNGAGLPSLFRAPIHFGCPLVTETFTDGVSNVNFLMNKTGLNAYEFLGGGNVSGVLSITDDAGFTVNLQDSGRIDTSQELASGSANFTLDLGNGPVTRSGVIANCP